MTVYLILFALGIVSASCLATLPSLTACLLLILPLALLFVGSFYYPSHRAFAYDLAPCKHSYNRQTYARALLALMCGCAWGVLYGYSALSTILPTHLAGQELMVQGQIVDLPRRDVRRQRFTLQVNQAHDLMGKNLSTEFPKRIQLSWYSQNTPLVSGEMWQLRVKLKPPRGFMNPTGFDYEAWLLRNRIGALGYVRNASENRLLVEANTAELTYWRFALQRWLLAHYHGPEAGILLALLVGERSLIDSSQWQTLQQTGTNHLVAISGLHIGFVALMGWLGGKAIGRLGNSVYRRCSPLVVGSVCAILFALFYSALAGFSLPTQRALIMVLVAQYAFIRRRTFRARDGLLLALVLVLMRDPLAAYDMGFWLSFSAVGLLLLAFSGRISATSRHFPGRNILYSQWVIFVGLLLPLTLLTNSVALLAPIANVVAIPLVTFIVVPALLVAALVQQLLPVVSEGLLSLAGQGVGFLLGYLEQLLRLADSRLNPNLALHPQALYLAALAWLLIILPRTIPGCWLGYPMLLLALVIPFKVPAQLQLTVLDVGQGLAIVVQTPEQLLVYDAGPSYGENFDAGSGVLIPYLHSQGLKQIDVLVLSHNDLDHVGGAPNVIAGMPVQQILWGETQRLDQRLTSVANRSCHGFPAWRSGAVSFQFLRWPKSLHDSPNNASCVLLIEYAGQTILLPGDIDQKIERQLLLQGDIPSALSVLVAAHHGSASSSSAALLAHTLPEHVIFSAGYKNQYRHPSARVLARFSALESQLYNTAEMGAIEFTWQSGATPRILSYRQQRRRYWHQ